MGITFKHWTGYRGVCAIKGGTGAGTTKAEMSTMVPLLCTGGSIQLGQDPIMSSGVWGAGYANIAPIAYAYNYLNLEGSANIEVTYNATKDPWAELKAMAFSGRTNKDNTILLAPYGSYGFYNFGWLSSLGFDASEGSAITANFNFKGDPSQKENGKTVVLTSLNTSLTGGQIDAIHGHWQETQKPPFVGGTLFAYWDTYVGHSGTTNNLIQAGTIDDVISWSCSYNSDLQFLKCCNKKPDLEGEDIYTFPVAADYIMCGDMSCDGSITVFGIDRDQLGISPKSLHSVYKNLTFYVGSRSIMIPMAFMSQGSTSMTSGAQYVTGEFSFTGLGDGYNSIMQMS